MSVTMQTTHKNWRDDTTAHPRWRKNTRPPPHPPKPIKPTHKKWKTDLTRVAPSYIICQIKISYNEEHTRKWWRDTTTHPRWRINTNTHTYAHIYTLIHTYNTKYRFDLCQNCKKYFSTKNAKLWQRLILYYYSNGFIIS